MVATSFSTKNTGTSAPIVAQDVALFTTLDEMWLHNWQQLRKSNDLKWIIKADEQRDLFVDKERLDWAFMILLDEWFELTDQQSNRRELFVLTQKLIKARDKVIHGDEFQQNFVRKYERMIADLFEDSAPVDEDKQRMAISAHLRMQIDKRKITVVDYYKLLESVAENTKSNPETDG